MSKVFLSNGKQDAKWKLPPAAEAIPVTKVARIEKLIATPFLLPVGLRMRRVLARILLFTSLLPVGNGISQEYPDEIFAAPPGIQNRILEQAKQALAAEDYPQAVESLSQIIHAHRISGDLLGEDFFLPTKRKVSTRSLRREAFEWIGNLPPAGREYFELKFGIAARKELERAIGEGKTSLLADVSRDYFHTRAGYVATLLMGREKMSSGQWMAAARSLRKLHSVESARSMLDPELSIRYSITLAKLQDLAGAISTIQSLKETHPLIRVELGGQTEELTLGGEDTASEWLTRLIRSHFGNSPSPREIEWLDFNYSSQHSFLKIDRPLALPAWSVAVVAPSRLPMLQKARRQAIENRISVVPSLGAVALKNSVIMRTPDRIVAVNVKTGKRSWLHPWNTNPVQVKETGKEAREEKRLRQRIWSDHGTGRIVSDGKTVFFVEATELPEPRSGAGGLRASRKNDSITNSLVALRVIDHSGQSVEGQLAWRTDSGNGTNPEFNGCFFLGPPLVRNGVAYTVVEKGGQIRLMVLDANNGSLLWSQQLASTRNQIDLQQKLFRCNQAATPVFVDGLLVCPTLVGGIVAIDPVDRTLVWGFRYESFRPWDYLDSELQSTTNFWHDNGLLVVDDHLLFSPVDSRKLYCLNIQSGRAKTTLPREDYLFLGGRYQQGALVVGPDYLDLVQVTGTGKSRIEFSNYGITTGRGLLAGGEYFLPVTGNQILRIDLEKKQVAQSISVAGGVGNLLLYRGQMISHSETGLTAYDLLSSSREVAKTRLEKNSRDSRAHLLLAQLLYLEGRLDQAIEKLIESIHSAGGNSSRSFLADLLVERFADEDAPELQRLADAYELLKEPGDRRKFLLAKIESLFRRQQGEAAIEDVLKLVELYALKTMVDGDLVPVSRSHSVDGKRLVRSRVRQALNSADALEQEKLANRFEDKFRAALVEGSPGQAMVLMELFGEFEFVKRNLTQIAGNLRQSNDPETLLFLEAILLEALEAPDHPTEKIRLLQDLSKTYARQELLSGVQQTAVRRRCLERLIDCLARKKGVIESEGERKELEKQHVAATSELQMLASPARDRLPHDGPVGIGLYENEEDFDFFEDGTERRLLSQLEKELRLARCGFSVYATDYGYFVIRDRHGRTVFQSSSRKRGGKHLDIGYELTHYQILGNLLVLSFGYDHVGIHLGRLDGENRGRSFLLDDRNDLLVGEKPNAVSDPVLWRFSSFEPVVGNRRRLSRLVRESNSLNLTVEQKLDPSGNRIGKTGWLSSHGYCLLNRQTLSCLDPWKGTLLWQRTDVPEKSDLAGDLNWVYLFSPDERTVTPYRVLDGMDGTPLEVPEGMLNRVLQHGPRVVGLRELKETVTLNGFELGPDKISKSWTREFSRGTRAHKINIEELAVLEPGGKFAILDPASGKTLLETTLSLESRFSTLQVFKRGDRYLVLVNRNSQLIIESRRSDQIKKPKQEVNLDGLLFCLDARGECWPSPARIDGFDFILQQPESAPLLLLKKVNRDRGTTEIILIRISDGSLVEFSRPVKMTGITSRVKFNPLENRLLFNFGFQWLQVEISSLPRPLSPPAQTGRNSGRPNAGKALAQQAADAVRDLFLENDDPLDPDARTLERWVESEQRKRPQAVRKKRVQRE
ncbi:MAG: PQQ-binding-like beta-propeller repeat protein [Planctomycetota bacterium]|nr:PQQ-binding-like beta-propeller repeat protein [Planctomycetota bacterium]